MATAIVITLTAAAACSAGLVVAMMPLLRRYALARPNARSSHAEPTPQGAGVAVVLATLLATGIGLVVAMPEGAAVREATLVLAASLLVAATGAIDDLRPLGPLAKLVPQIVAVCLVVLLAAPAEARLFPALPFAIERALVILAGVWFVNLVNFMDGIDWITVAGCGVPLAALAALGGVATSQTMAAPLLAAALCGALIGFAPFNKPVARVFLGDVGSLPIGLILGYGLYRLALAGHLAAALILPLYYLWDSGATLLRRLSRREAFWEAHRSHVYQRATDAGWSVAAVVGHIFVLELVLDGLALICIWQDSIPVSGVTLVLATVLVAAISARLTAGPSDPRETFT
ncbi:MAG: glycosyl transferase [Bradyrhizobium sp.]|uniref:glycosyl transferase n=1 Tax=Bradyrhizobium sp. TaxID=376 RepID=UPI001D3EB014|nr:glycosyl transferase [Bradyrhizobium sp.]MBV9563394.1 glycosyl transferase [Bradyrhizobium sp.]